MNIFIRYKLIKKGKILLSNNIIRSEERRVGKEC